MKFLLLSLSIAAISIPSLAQTPYGSCPERAQTYQERYERNGQAKDLVCYQNAIEREMFDSSTFACPRSAQHYQTAFETYGRSNDLICFQNALQREMQ
jgi:hypothetical protein